MARPRPARPARRARSPYPALTTSGVAAAAFAADSISALVLGALATVTVCVAVVALCWVLANRDRSERLRSLVRTWRGKGRGLS